MLVRGIDVSKYQKLIDWPAVANPDNSIKFAIIKIGGADDGLYTDAYGDTNLKGASKAGLAVGAYWYFSIAQPIDAQAQRIETLLTYSRVTLTKGLWIDVEGQTLTPAEVKGVYTLVMELRRRGYAASATGIYTRANIWNDALAADPTLPTADSLGIPLWVANYKPPIGEPIMPKGWAKWTAWQWSSTGTVPGISGPVDMDLWDLALAPNPPTLEESAYKVKAPLGLNIRTAPNTASPVVAHWVDGAQPVMGTPQNGWLKMRAQVGGLQPAISDGTPLFYYSSLSYMAPVGGVQPPDPILPPPTTRKPYRIGVHVIGNWRAADEALQAGAPVIFGMHGHLEMVHRARAYPDRIFIYRGYVPAGSRPSPRDVFNLLQVGSDDPPNIWYVGTNENDHYGDDPTALRGRVLWDKDLFYMLRDVKPGVRYFGLSLGHGCPGGIEDPDGPVVAALMGYGPLWDEGMGIDLHNYTRGKRYPDDPVSDSPIHDPIWYEDRGKFWFTNGILNPRKGGGFIHGETGVEANQGGYQWAGYNQQQFGRHIRTLSDIGRSAIVIPSGPNAGTWPSVDEAGAIFQMGDTNTGPGGWGGYNVEGQLPELRTFWAEGR